MIDLSLLLPEFKQALEDFIYDAQNAGMDVDVESAFRSSAEQDRLYSLGRTTQNPDGLSVSKPLGNIVTNARGGHSWHNWGVAADVVFRKNGSWDWNASTVKYVQLANVASKHGLRWGGSWTGQGAALGDVDHFEYTGGLTIADAITLGTIPAVWGKIRSKMYE